MLFEYPELEKGSFVTRYKRFFVDVVTSNGTREAIHCANSGSMKSCLDEGCDVYFSRSTNEKRKLKGSLELMRLSDGLACLNTQRANDFVSRFLETIVVGPLETKNRVLSELDEKCARLIETDLSQFVSIKREARFTDETRFDFLVTSSAASAWIEVKSVSLRLSDTVLAFPDARTERGEKHLNALIEAKQQGSGAFLYFVAMRASDKSAIEVAQSFRAAHEIDPKYAAALKNALETGVQVRVVVPEITTRGFKLRGYFEYGGMQA